MTETETTPVSGVHVTGTYVTETEKVALKDAFNLLLARCLSIYRTLKATNRAHRREFERKLRAANLGYVFFLVRAIGENWKDDAEAEVRGDRRARGVARSHVIGSTLLRLEGF